MNIKETILNEIEEERQKIENLKNQHIETERLNTKAVVDAIGHIEGVSELRCKGGYNYMECFYFDYGTYHYFIHTSSLDSHLQDTGKKLRLESRGRLDGFDFHLIGGNSGSSFRAELPIKKGENPFTKENIEILWLLAIKNQTTHQRRCLEK